MSTVCNGNVMDGQGDYEGAVVLKDEADGVCIRIMQQIGKGGEGGGADCRVTARELQCRAFTKLG